MYITPQALSESKYGFAVQKGVSRRSIMKMPVTMAAKPDTAAPW